MLEFENIPENEIIISEAIRFETEREFPILKRQYEFEKEADKAYFNNLKYGSEKTMETQQAIAQQETNEQKEKEQISQLKTVQSFQKEEELKEEKERFMKEQMAQLSELKLKKQQIELHKEEKNEYLGKSNYDEKVEKVEKMIEQKEDQMNRLFSSEFNQEWSLKQPLEEENPVELAKDFKKIEVNYKDTEYHLHLIKLNHQSGLQTIEEMEKTMMKELNQKYKENDYDYVVKNAKEYTMMKRNVPELSMNINKQYNQQSDFIRY